MRIGVDTRSGFVPRLRSVPRSGQGQRQVRVKDRVGARRTHITALHQAAPCVWRFGNEGSPPRASPHPDRRPMGPTLLLHMGENEDEGEGEGRGKGEGKGYGEGESEG